jgi:single-stranded DNA-specific DHH superfamily exonuclease
MVDSSHSGEHRKMHEQLLSVRSALAATRAALDADIDAVESFRHRVMEVVAGTEDTARLLRVNSIRREVAAAQVRSTTFSHCLQELRP